MEGNLSRADLRRTMFVLQDGVMLSTTLRALDEVGILEASLDAERSLAELLPDIAASGFGYLRVAIRCLASQGWLADGPALDPETTILRWADAGRSVMLHRDRYVRAGRFLAELSSSQPDAWLDPWDPARTEAFLELLEPARDRWDIDPALPAGLRELTITHLDAGLVVPALLWLGTTGRLAGEGPEIPDGDVAEGIRELFAILGWIDPANGAWTAGGRHARALAMHTGLVGSYLPLLARLPELYRGELVVGPSLSADTVEWHVQRQLNIVASAAAHGRYFADADAIFVELFNREPVEAQPRFVADMGCGDGSWLIHLYGLIAAHTLRGQELADQPLLMVGVDCNPPALEQARQALDMAGVPSLVLPGDIGDPEGLASALAAHGLAMEDGLHIRSFIDHDRTYSGAGSEAQVPGWSTGAYVDAAGHPLSGPDVEADLIAHLGGWAPRVRKHGVVVLEAHCVAPRIARDHVGALHSVTFDAYHGYSHQYPVDHQAFIRCCRQAGLPPTSYAERRYPSSRPFVAVSLNRLLASEPESLLPAPQGGHPRSDTWGPEPGTDLEDGRALHELLFEDGDLRHPRMWCSGPTGYVVAAALDRIERRLADAREGDVIRVLDYGAGTGLAAIELLKACGERDLEGRLERRGASLELHLVDLPSSWLAQGFELLAGCAWTRFHSLRDEEGRFRPLLEVTGGLRMDVIMASMVFHLIPARALGRVAADLASIVAPGGVLAWSSPDLGPAGPYAALFHDPNRALRERWLERVAAEGQDPTESGQAQSRADRRILPRPNDADDVATALNRHFAGKVERRTYEILEADILDALLVPSNQSEFLPEISDPARREERIRALMLGEVLPGMRAGPAGTSLGLNVQWTLGVFAHPA